MCMQRNNVVITTKQVAELACVDSSTVRRWVEKGQLTPTIVTPGGQYRFDEEDVRSQLAPTVKALLTTPADSPDPKPESAGASSARGAA